MSLTIVTAACTVKRAATRSVPGVRATRQVTPLLEVLALGLSEALSDVLGQVPDLAEQQLQQVGMGDGEVDVGADEPAQHLARLGRPVERLGQAHHQDGDAAGHGDRSRSSLDGKWL